MTLLLLPRLKEVQFEHPCEKEKDNNKKFDSKIIHSKYLLF